MNDSDTAQKLLAIESRLVRIESALAEAAQLRAALQPEVESRRQFAEQAAYLLEMLGEARRELKSLRADNKS